MTNKQSDELVTVSEYAKSVSVTRQAIEKAMTTGRLPKETVVKTDIDGKPITLINKTEADKYWVLYANPLYGTPASRAAVERIKAEQTASGVIQPVVTSDKEKISLQEAQRIEKVAKAGLAQLELSELQGVLVRKDVIYKQLFEAGRIIRDEIMGVPDRVVAEIVAAGGDVTKIRHILTEALGGALEGLADLHTKKLG